ncbi:MAG: NF038122 family metalloprotease [Verrucomicrobiota bacterium]|nr:NF038122 family metalloprotease [Verrucomicrobiota bacterium]
MLLRSCVTVSTHISFAGLVVALLLAVAPTVLSAAEDLTSQTPGLTPAAGEHSQPGELPVPEVLSDARSARSASAESSGVSTGGANGSAGLIINATFDSSITSSPDAETMKAIINQAIATYQSLFSDPITVSILFRYAPTNPDGTAIAGSIARSNYVYYTIRWGNYISALTADAKTFNDSSANNSLPANALSANVRPTSANGRALGLNTPPAMYADSSVSSGGSYDGIVTLNSSARFQFTRPTAFGNYDALRSLEHEIDEVLGLGSYLGTSSSDLRPEDLFAWAAPGSRSLIATGARYFSIDSGSSNLVSLNQTASLDYGDWLSAPCPQSQPFVQNASSCTGQYSDVTGSSPEGVSLDVIGYDLVATAQLPAAVRNVSTRLSVLGGDSISIAGFIVTGTAPKKVLLRGIGPSLGSVGVNGALADPMLQLFQGSTVLASNDNWKVNSQTGFSQEAEIRATTIPPVSDLESAIVQTLQPGAYTATLRGKTGGTGIGLVEAYDLEPSASSRLANISTRGFVDVGDNVMIGGFILGPANAGTTKVVVRALGPSLGDKGVAGSLQDPTLELHDANGGTVATNDDWQQDTSAGEIQSNNLAPGDSREAAVIRALAPGNYTAIVAGYGNSTGVGLVEVYNLATN